MLLVLVGAGATIYFDFSSYGLPFLLVSGTYTLIALLYFLKSFYSLIDQYGLLEGAVLSSADEHRHNKRFYELSKEFNEHSQYFRDLYSARAQAKEKIQDSLRLGNVDEARNALLDFKKKETRALVRFFDFTAPRMQFRRGEEFQPSKSTQTAFEHYLKRHLRNTNVPDETSAVGNLGTEKFSLGHEVKIEDDEPIASVKKTKPERRVPKKPSRKK